MQITDLRADILESINAYLIEEIAAFESADNDNVILITAADGNRYKLTIEKS
jgi:hypothetical protein